MTVSWNVIWVAFIFGVFLLVHSFAGLRWAEAGAGAACLTLFLLKVMTWQVNKGY